MIKQTIDKKRQEGFTIIEVLIVLAIAGLIILIVFLAVPALQRNSRNTQRKNDVSAVLGAFSEYVTNNQGGVPANQAAFINNAKLGFYQSADVNYPATRPASAITSSPGTDPSIIYIRDYAKCATATTVETTASNITRRNVIAWYFVETSGGTQAQCQDI